MFLQPLSHEILVFKSPRHPKSHENNIISIPGSLKTWTWNQSSILPFKSQKNQKIMLKLGPRRHPKSTLKSIRMDIWASESPLGAPLGPRTTKTVPQVPKKVPRGHKKEPQGVKNRRFRYRKITHCSNEPISQFSPILQSAINSLTNLPQAFSCLLLAVTASCQGVHFQLLPLLHSAINCLPIYY